MKYNLNKKGIVHHWLEFLFFIVVAIFFFLFFFGFFYSGAKAKLTPPDLLDNELHRNVIQFLQTPVSLVDSNYKTTLLADKDDIFADIIPRLCSQDDKKKKKFPDVKGYLGGFYYESQNNIECISGKDFSDVAYEFFLNLGRKQIGIDVFDGSNQILDYNHYYPDLKNDKLLLNPSKIEIMLPSNKPFQTIKIIVGG